jgi:hypothetical protein
MFQNRQKVIEVSSGDLTRVVKVQAGTGDLSRVPVVTINGVSGRDQRVQVVAGGDTTRIPVLNGVSPILGLSPVAFFRYGEGITVTGAGVSQWDDATGLGHHLLQGTDSARPALQADGSILFNGTAHFLKATAFTLIQPTTVVLVVKQVSWTANDYVADGNASNSMAVYQSLTTPGLRIFAGGGITQNDGLVVGSVGVVIGVFNGASSLTSINNGTAVTGNAGAANGGGFTLGAIGAGTSAWANIQAYEAAIFPSALSAADRARVASYLMAKFSIA